MTKVNVKALTTFSHGNVDAKEGGTYAMNKGDAQELEKAGFVAFGGENPEQTQADSAEDLLGDGEKMAETPENKMAEAPRNKSVAKK